MTRAMSIVPPGRPVRGSLSLPGSKSITNRALLLAALAPGTSRLTGALKSDDTRFMAEALQRMGVTIREPEADSFVVTGNGRLQAPDGPLFLGNAGTATRFLTAAASLADGTVVITGDAHMQKRPIAPLLTALRDLGVAVEAPTGCPPVTVRGRGGFHGEAVTIDAGLSSQYASALLMVAACGSRPVRVSLAGDAVGALGYIDVTAATMRHFGATVEKLGSGAWEVRPGGYRATELQVEPDASAATYLWAAAALTGGAIDIGMPASALSQPDAGAHALIQSFPRMPAIIDGSQMQDAVPTLAALAVFNETPVRFVGIANLRVKECDRVSAMATELSRLSPGLAVEDGDDLVVSPAPMAGLRGARITTYSDHRIAMSMALVGLRVPGLVILDPACVAKTYPRFWDDFASLGVTLREVAA